MAVHKNPPVPRRLVGRATSHQVRLQHTQDLVKICEELGWRVNSELEPKHVFDLRAGFETSAMTNRNASGSKRFRPFQPL